MHATTLNQLDRTDVRSKLKIFQGAFAAISFSLLLAGTNATTPLLPVYRELLGFSPLTLSLTFVAYVSTLVICLISMSRPSLVGWSPILLSVALLVMIIADLNLAIGTEGSIMIGRVLAGVAVGLGTGPAAALVVAAFGQAGRSVTATGNLSGAVVGTALSQAAVTLLGGRVAVALTFQTHAMLCAIILTVVVPTFLILRRENRRLLLRNPTEGGSVIPTMRGNMIPLLVGSLAWIAVSAAITFLPSFFEERGLGAAKLVGVLTLLISCAASQLGSDALSKSLPRISGVETMLCGLVLILLSAHFQNQALVICGFAILGAGIGLAYRIGLVVLTRGATPVQQGVLASSYAAVTYAAAAVGVIGIGLAGNVFGLEATTITMLAAISAACALLLRHAPKIGA